MNKTTLAVAVALVMGFTAVSADKQEPAKGDGGRVGTSRLQTIKIKLEGDKLTQSSQLSASLKIEEVWRRAK